MPEGITVAYTNQAGNRRRVRFERKSPGGWDRVVEEYSAGKWREAGAEIVSDLEVEIDADVTDVVDVVPPGEGQSGTVVTGP